MRDRLTPRFHLRCPDSGLSVSVGQSSHREYRALAARAKLDPSVSKRFKESRLSIDRDPCEAMSILRAHPLMESGLNGSGKNEGFGFWLLNNRVGLSFKSLVLSLAKLSVREGGEEAAWYPNCTIIRTFLVGIPDET